MIKNISICLACVIIVLLCHNIALGFEVAVHQAITKNAIDYNRVWFNNYLNIIGLPNGVAEEINKKPLREWIEGGSKQEDEPIWSLRYTYHFYNPLDGAGLKGLKSSYEWAIDDGTSLLGNSWSWRIARDKFYTGMTAAGLADRQVALADSLRAVGQVLHLVQDLASPAHVRNDAHPLGNSFENFTLAKINELNYSPVSISIPTTSVSPYAPRQLWDTDKYNGNNQLSGTDIGLAEYTNANFFSEDSITSPEFPYPSKNLSNYYQCADAAPPGSWVSKRRYLSRTACPTDSQQGSIDHFLVWSFLPSLQPGVISPAMRMDDRVNRDYANQLIPRAVGYSAGLLKYFFRGILSYATLDEGSVKVYNHSDEPLASGVIELYYDDESDLRRFLASHTITTPIQSGQASEPISFTPPTDNKRPGRYWVVFRGKLGGEEDAVIGDYRYYWDEQWDNGLKGNHPWLYSDTDLVHQNPFAPPHGTTINIVEGGNIKKTNIRYAGSDMAHVNQTLIADAYKKPVSDPTPYCTDEYQKYCIAEDFGREFPIFIDNRTWLVLKIDSMSTNVPIAAPSCGSSNWPVGEYQRIHFRFQMGDGSTRKVEFTAGHRSYLAPSVEMPLGEMRAYYLYNLLQQLGAVVPPVSLQRISIAQQMMTPCSPTPQEHIQYMEVDHIGIFDGTVYEGEGFEFAVMP